MNRSLGEAAPGAAAGPAPEAGPGGGIPDADMFVSVAWPRMCQYRAMPDRLSALDASLLYVEEATTPMHIGWVAIFRRPRSGFGYDELVDLIEERIALVPRYRQKVRSVPGHLARPVWTDDQNFDVTHHVRLSALPKPGTEEQLAMLVGRLMSRPLDPNRPRWELYLVEGLQRNRFALITKTHYAMVEGTGAMEIGQVILDPTPHSEPEEPALWMPAPEPNNVQLVADAVAEVVRRPGELVDNIRAAVDDLASTGRKAVHMLAGVASVVTSAARPAPAGPLNVRSRGERRFAMARARLIDLKKIRIAYGSTVNDVVLAVVAGALRSWLLSRGEAVTTQTSNSSSSRSSAVCSRHTCASQPATTRVLRSSAGAGGFCRCLGRLRALPRGAWGAGVRSHSPSPSSTPLKCILARVLRHRPRISAGFSPSLDGFCSVPQAGTSSSFAS